MTHLLAHNINRPTFQANAGDPVTVKTEGKVMVATNERGQEALVTKKDLKEKK